MDRNTFTKILDEQNIDYKIQDNKIVITHEGYLSLPSVTTLPNGIVFKNGGAVYLDRVTTLPNDIVFKNGGGVYLPSVTGKHLYQGKEREFIHIDGFTMLLEKTNQKGEATILSSRYFGGGDVSKLRKCFIAQENELSAHGSTIEEALSDLNYKVTLQASAEEIVREIKNTNKVTLSQFRSLTGACVDGIRQHLKPHGIDINTTTEIELDQALELMNKTSFGKAFKKALNKESA